jgi:hypothetical protein
LKSHGDRFSLCGEWSQHLAQHGVQRGQDSVGHMQTGVVMQHNDIPREHAGMIPLDSSLHSAMAFGRVTTLSTKELNDSLLLLFGLILHVECWHLTVSHFSCYSLWLTCWCVMHTAT